MIARHAFFIKNIFILIVLFTFSPAYAQIRKIALTFDDAPRNDTAYFSAKERSKKLVATLLNAQVKQATFFCNSERFDGGGLEILKLYTSAGHLLANHTHSHKDLHAIDAAEFLDDIRQADEYLHKLPNFRAWFRFPFLREGNNEKKRDYIRNNLKQMGYRNGYVTIDNYDWWMDKVFQDAVQAGKQINFQRLSKAYVDILVDAVEFYDNIALKALRHSPSHVMLLHENDLAALFVGDFVKRLRSDGWEIITTEKAYKDPIAKIEPLTLTGGQGHVVAIAIDRGYQESVVSQFESESAIEEEFKRRKIFE